MRETKTPNSKAEKVLIFHKGNTMAQEVYSPYQAVKRINEEELALRKVAPQELYAAVRGDNPKVKSKTNEVGHIIVRWADVEAWVAGINAKVEAKAKQAETADAN